MLFVCKSITCFLFFQVVHWMKNILPVLVFYSTAASQNHHCSIESETQIKHLHLDELVFCRIYCATEVPPQIID